MTDLSRRINDFLKPYIENRAVTYSTCDSAALSLLKEAVEALAARDAQIAANATLAEDRDAAWRFARAAADGHDHNRQILADIARVFGRVDDWDTLPARVQQVVGELGGRRKYLGETFGPRLWRLIQDFATSRGLMAVFAETETSMEIKLVQPGDYATTPTPTPESSTPDATSHHVAVRFEAGPLGGIHGCAWLVDERGNGIALLAEERMTPMEVADRARHGSVVFVLGFPASAVNPGPKSPVSGA